MHIHTHTNSDAEGYKNFIINQSYQIQQVHIYTGQAPFLQQNKTICQRQ